MIKIEKMIDANRHNVVEAIGITKDLIDTYSVDFEMPELDNLVIELNNLIIKYDKLVNDFHNLVATN